MVNIPEGNLINGWDVNVSSVRTTSIKRHVKYHTHAEFIIRVRRGDNTDIRVGRRFGDFRKMRKQLHTELPGKVLPPLPRKSHSTSFLGSKDDDDDDASSVSSVSTQNTTNITPATEDTSLYGRLMGHKASRSISRSPRPSGEHKRGGSKLWREDQRVSLRAYIRTLLQNPQIAASNSMLQFLTTTPIKLNEEERGGEDRRKEMDAKRVEEQQKFYEIARKRAHELDVYMEKFRRDMVESNGLTKLFKQIRDKHHIAELDIEYRKFAEWLRIEVAATIYHLFLAEDNSPELFAQAKRVHSLMPYTILKNVIRIANPALVMNGVLDLFLAQPLGTRSLMQRIFSMTLNDGIRGFQKSIDSVIAKVEDPILCEKIETFVNSTEDVKDTIREEAVSEDMDIVIAALRSDLIAPELTPQQVGRVFNAYVAWNSAIVNVGLQPSLNGCNGTLTCIQVDQEMKTGAETFAYLKQLLKLYTRQRDKTMMLRISEEPVTMQLFKDLFQIFYEPLIRVYKSANVYNSVTDFADFMTDLIQVVEKAQRQDIGSDPNVIVQSFIDLCERHQDDFYKFVHEVHTHDNGLFEQLMGWLEGILDFLRNGPKGGKLDINALFQGAVSARQIDVAATKKEIDDLITWQADRKQWHSNKTRQKLAAENGPPSTDIRRASQIRSSDFGLNEEDINELQLDGDSDSDSDDEDEAADDLDPIAAERRRRGKAQDRLRRRAGEPQKPEVSEIYKLGDGFVAMLRNVLAE